MSEGTKNTLIDLAKIFGGMGVLIALIYLIPNGSVAQKILGFLMGIALLLGIIWYTALGNPIKRLYRKIFKK